MSIYKNKNNPLKCSQMRINYRVSFIKKKKNDNCTKSVENFQNPIRYCCLSVCNPNIRPLNYKKTMSWNMLRIFLKKKNRFPKSLIMYSVLIFYKKKKKIYFILAKFCSTIEVHYGFLCYVKFENGINYKTTPLAATNKFRYIDGKFERFSSPKGKRPFF